MTSPIEIVQARVEFRDPHDCTDSADARALLAAVFDALVRRRADGGYVSALASSWATTPNARDWTFKLRRGVSFHDGTPFNAGVMRYSIERMMRPDIGATLGAPAVWRQYFGTASVETPDDATLIIRLAEPIADLLDILVHGYALPPHLADLEDFALHPIGTGAYRVEGPATPGRIRMTANPSYWGGVPENPGLVWREVPRPADRAQALAEGEAAIATRLPPTDAQSLDDARVTATRYMDPTAIIFLLNGAGRPFRVQRVRRAINLATDRNALIQAVLAGAARPLGSLVSEVHMAGDPLHDPAVSRALESNRQEARQLLGEAGYPNGVPIVVDCPTSLPDEAQALTAALSRQVAAAGFRLEVRTIADRTAYAETVRDKKIHDMCVFDSSPLSTFRVLYEKIDSRSMGAWWQGYQNEAVEALPDTARKTTDLDARTRLYREILTILRNDPPWLTLYNHELVAAIAGDHPRWRIGTDGVLDVAALPALK